jgi:cell division protein FtsW (lipid II flippase)
MQLLFLPAVCAVIGLLILVTVRTGVARWGWQDMSVGLAVVFAFYVVSIFFSAVGFAGDEVLFPITAALASLGFLMIQRLGPAVSPSAHLAEKQLLYLLVALVLMTTIAVGMKRQHLRLLRDYKYSWALVGIALTAAVMVFGVEINGARLWFNLKFFYFQPAELLKIILVVFFAAYLSEKRELLNAPYAIGRVRLPPLPYMLPMIALWGLSLMIVVVEKDLGQGLLIFGVFLAMLYLANGKIGYVIGGLIAFAIGAYILYRIFPHVQVRVQIWLDPWSTGQGTGAQLVQSQYALAAGGIFGTGLGLGDPTNIPLVQTDFVFSAIGEEMGLLGTMALLVFYLFFVYRGVRIALDAVDDFSRYLAAGLTAVLGLQAFIIIGGTVGLFPLTGITLPFISYGGSSLLSNFIIVGMLLAISGMRPGRAVAIPGVPT